VPLNIRRRFAVNQLDESLALNAKWMNIVQVMEGKRFGRSLYAVDSLLPKV